MIRALIGKKIDSLERQFGAPLDYLRHMLRVSLRCTFEWDRQEVRGDWK